MDILYDEFQNYFNNFKDKQLLYDNTYKVIKKYQPKYQKTLSPDMKHQVYLYSQQPRENRKDLILINPKILDALKIILFEKFTLLILNKLTNFKPECEEVNEDLEKETKIPLKRKREDIYEELDRIKIPTRFICPISKEIMEDPVICPLGYTYDRKSITNWFIENNTTPLTGEKLFVKFLIPNHQCKSDLSEYLEKIKKNILKKIKE